MYVTVLLYQYLLCANNNTTNMKLIKFSQVSSPDVAILYLGYSFKNLKLIMPNVLISSNPVRLRSISGANLKGKNMKTIILRIIQKYSPLELITLLAMVIAILTLLLALKIT